MSVVDRVSALRRSYRPVRLAIGFLAALTGAWMVLFTVIAVRQWPNRPGTAMPAWMVWGGLATLAGTVLVGVVMFLFGCMASALARPVLRDPATDALEFFAEWPVLGLAARVAEPEVRRLLVDLTDAAARRPDLLTNRRIRSLCVSLIYATMKWGRSRNPEFTIAILNLLERVGRERDVIYINRMIRNPGRRQEDIRVHAAAERCIAAIAARQEADRDNEGLVRAAGDHPRERTLLSPAGQSDPPEAEALRPAAPNAESAREVAAQPERPPGTQNRSEL